MSKLAGTDFGFAFSIWLTGCVFFKEKVLLSCLVMASIPLEIGAVAAKIDAERSSIVYCNNLSLEFGISLSFISGWHTLRVLAVKLLSGNCCDLKGKQRAPT